MSILSCYFRKFLSTLVIFTFLTACGGGGSSSTPDASSVPNQQPVANAGANQSVLVGQQVQLDGGVSSEPNAWVSTPTTWLPMPGLVPGR